MSSSTMGRTPAMKAVAAEQFRVVGLGVRREALALCAGLVLVLLIAPFIDEIVVDAGPILSPTDLGVVAVLLGLVSPLAVWRGEALFGESQLWTVPVDHARHARMKVAAGWVWLMGVVSVGVLAIALLVVFVGGDTAFEGVRWLVIDPDGARSGAAGSLRQVPWNTPPWQWAHPFAVATWGYLAASALLLGLRRPYHWAVGGWLVFLAFGVLGEEGNIPWVSASLDSFLRAIDLLGSGGSESVQMTAVLDSGERVRAWTRFPTFGGWIAGMALWMGLALASLWAASGRHRES